MSNNQNNTRLPKRIEVLEPETLEVFASTALITTQQLAKRVNKLFSTAFVDYYGCVIYRLTGQGNQNMNQQFMVELHFKPLNAGAVDPSDSRVRAFKPVTENTDGPALLNGLRSIYAPYTQSTNFEITQDGSEILSEFMFTGLVDPFKPASYKGAVQEYQTAPSYMGNGPIMIRVQQLDLAKLVKKIYGYKSKEGTKLEYSVAPHLPVNGANFQNANIPGNANWWVMITPIDVDKMTETASQLGFIPAGNGADGVITGV